MNPMIVRECAGTKSPNHLRMGEAVATHTTPTTTCVRAHTLRHAEQGEGEGGGLTLSPLAPNTAHRLYARHAANAAPHTIAIACTRATPQARTGNSLLALPRQSSSAGRPPWPRPRSRGAARDRYRGRAADGGAPMMAVFEAGQKTVMFAPMLSILCWATRMRALQLAKAEDGTIPPTAGPPYWAQDCMYLATWSVPRCQTGTKHDLWMQAAYHVTT